MRAWEGLALVGTFFIILLLLFAFVLLGRLVFGGLHFIVAQFENFQVLFFIRQVGLPVLDVCSLSLCGPVPVVFLA